MPTWDAQQNANRSRAAAEQQLRQYLGSLTPEQRRAYLASRADLLDGEDPPAPQQQAPQQRAPIQHRPFGAQPMHQQQEFVRDYGPKAQTGALQDMIDDVTDAHQDENDSRVSQLREMRRMEHEKEIEAARQETERLKIEALLKRLGEAQGGSGGQTVYLPGGGFIRHAL